MQKPYKAGTQKTIFWNSGNSQKVTIVTYHFNYIYNEYVYKVKELRKNILHSNLFD